ncbi:MAG: HEAT repeat domain-containing protein [Candidatus Poribacteria bacterium]|nr:HEAT repeat domain-containing protein [Candidatus Poribacteria bacterium]MDE0325728.1 HEAT repeat domain-containing protein [Candidatus Poribacteria bacterium]
MNRKINFRNACNRYPIADMEKAVQDLKYGRKTYPAFNTSLYDEDDSRFTRQDAIDFFRFLSAGKPELINNDILGELHQSLFDCCAAVRLATVQTLGILGRKESLTPLRDLQSIENESDWVKMAVEEAIQAIEGSLDLKTAKFVKDPSVLS